MAADATQFDEADLNAFADGRLEPARAAALAESLATDRLARARVDGWKRQNDGLRTLFASVLFEPVPVRLLPTTLAAAAGPVDPAPPLEPRSPGQGSSTALLGMGALGAAMVGFALGVLATIATDGFERTGRDWRDTGLRATERASAAERAAETFRAALADPGRAADFSTGDETRLQHWMIRQLSGAARIPDLRREGWALIDGRVVPGRYAPAAFLSYGRGSERLGLYMAREPMPTPVRTALFASDAVAVRSWSSGGLATAIASSRDPGQSTADLESLSDIIRRQTGDDQTSP